MADHCVINGHDIPASRPVEIGARILRVYSQAASRKFTNTAGIL
jgi:hypothetical protein